ncbi:MAG: bifunctional 4-hydroxy-2-oxoglutarate aldolase/2-dehydro-3-deoxy-phosphogluconate aldolase [Planctomycetota bacterium]
MARFDRLTVLNAMVETGLVPVFYNGDLEVAKQIVTACAAGGARVVEFTNRGDRAVDVFTDLIAWADEACPEVILGVGSVIEAPTGGLYIAAGANFVVGPVMNRELARLCNRRQIAYSPGCGSVTEISDAQELGCEIVKVFPGTQVGGPDFIRAVRGPMPWTRLMPTGGVSAEEGNVKGWIRAGAACLGMGSKLVRKDLVAAGDFDGVIENVRNVLRWISEVREQQ